MRTICNISNFDNCIHSIFIYLELFSWCSYLVFFIVIIRSIFFLIIMFRSNTVIPFIFFLMP